MSIRCCSVRTASGAATYSPTGMSGSSISSASLGQSGGPQVLVSGLGNPFSRALFDLTESPSVVSNGKLSAPAGQTRGTIRKSQARRAADARDHRTRANPASSGKRALRIPLRIELDKRIRRELTE